MATEALSFIFKKDIHVAAESDGGPQTNSFNKTHEAIRDEINQALRARNAQYLGHFALTAPSETMKKFPEAMVGGIIVFADVPDESTFSLQKELEQLEQEVQHGDPATLASLVEPPVREPELVVNQYDIKT